MRSRRFALLAAGLLVGGLLAGCRSSPTVAAYLNSGNITEAKVNRMMDELTQRSKEINDQATSAAASGAPGPALVNVPARSAVVNLLVSERLCQKVAEMNGILLTGLPGDEVATPDDVATNYHIAFGTEFATHAANQATCTNALSNKLGDGPPLTDAQYREIYDRGMAANAIPGLTFEQARSALAQNPELSAKISRAFAERAALQQAVKAENLALNPRYAPMSLLLMSLTGNSEFAAVVLDVATDSVPVKAAA
jgi:hypothetical protein